MIEAPKKERTPAQAARRRRKNIERKAARRRIKEMNRQPPVVALSKSQYRAMFGLDADYDAYADAFIKGARKQFRRYEFPLEAR